MSSAPIAPRASRKISGGKKGKASLLQLFSSISNVQCSLGEIHAYNWRTKQPLRPVDMIPNKLRSSWVPSREEQRTKHLVQQYYYWQRPPLSIEPRSLQIQEYLRYIDLSYLPLLYLWLSLSEWIEEKDL
jgi:hypothetical protein